MKKFNFLVATLALACVSCAPQTLGSRGNPVELSERTSLRVVRGQETFFKLQAPIGLIDRGTRDRTFANEFKDISQISPGRFVTAPVIWFKLGKVQAPAGVQFELVYQEARREAQRLDTTSSTTYIYFTLVDSATIIGAVRVAPDAALGVTAASLEIATQSAPAASLVVPFRLNVTESSGN